MATRNSSQEGKASKQMGKVKIPKSRPYMEKKKCIKLKNFLFDMDKYFQAVGITLEEA